MSRAKKSARLPARESARGPAPAPYRVGFLLFPEFPMMAFAAAIEPLRAANRLTGATLFEWRLFSRDGEAVRASNGIDIAVDGATGEEAKVDMLLACAGTRDAGADDAAVAKWLRALARSGTTLGGISLGAYVLAYAGLLDGRRCALHWESLDAFSERFPRIRTTTDIFVIDGNRCTCAGGTVALDMMLQVITTRDGRALANDVSEQFIHPHIRGTQDSQRMAIQSRLGVANQKLIAAIGMMENAHDEPRPVHEIAQNVELSARQLERLFAKYLGATPSHYYLRLRLDRARQMLLQTTKPIIDVAVACGFASASHFSRCYRAAYARKPSDERAAALVARPSRQPARRA
ncbi:MAG: GlxA family transcriptional regulator [Burkholderiaceae bacterium]|nr:GlxA family transcriptional regulator [Burkholderiaceae bacterium]